MPETGGTGLKLYDTAPVQKQPDFRWSSMLLAPLLVTLPLSGMRGVQDLLMLASILLVCPDLCRAFRHLPATSAWLAWTLWACASAFWAISPVLAFKLALLDTVVAAMLFFVAYQLAIAAPGRAWAMIRVAAPLAALLLALTCMAPLHVGPLAQSGWLGRLYPGPGVVSTMAILLMPVLWLSWRHTGSYLALISGVLMLVAVGVASDNRMFWVVLPVVLAICMLGGIAKRPSRLSVGVLAGVLIVACLSGLLYTSKARFGAARGEGVAATAVDRLANDPRLAGWSVWFAHAGLHPWKGYGYGKRELIQTVPNDQQQVLRHIDDNILAHGHNLFLNLLLQTGVVGLLLWLGVIARLASQYGYGISAPGRRLYATVGLAMIAGLILKNMTDDFVDGRVLYLFWFWSGMILGLQAEQR